MALRSVMLEQKEQDKGGRLMKKVHATIVAVLQALGAPVHRTKLVKLIYLIDELYHEHFGQTLTGLAYMWDDFGPNAVGNAIVKEADRLVLKGIVHIDPRPNYYGETSYLYSLEPMKSDLAEELSEAEQYVVSDVIAHYAKYGVRDIVRISKQTESFKDTEQYSLLKMKKSAEYNKLMEDINSDPNFVKSIKEAVQELKQTSE